MTASQKTQTYMQIYTPMGSHESWYYSDDVFKKHNLHVSDASWSIKYIYVHLFIWILQKFKKCADILILMLGMSKL